MTDDINLENKSYEQSSVRGVDETIHKSVLLNETIEGLQIRPKSIFLDCTLGGAGHSLAVCQRLSGDVRIIALDQDRSAIRRAQVLLQKNKCKVTFLNSNFGDVKDEVVKTGVGKIDSVLFDLGLSSDQLDFSNRGFSFKRNEPLIMTLKDSHDSDKNDFTAFDIVNFWEAENIELILKVYGEERFARRIALAIVAGRGKKQITNTLELADIVRDAYPKIFRLKSRIDPATKTFQAIRMAVNDEITVLKKGLSGAYELLNIGGRMAVISFHSGEDRVVKNFMREKVSNKEGVLINKKPIVPSGLEIDENPRSRSAKLRIIEKIK